jgi:GNAT superfamily N-acetyltransferase
MLDSLQRDQRLRPSGSALMCRMTSIRTATPHDADSISRVHADSWRTTYRGIVPDVYLANLNAEERSIRWRERLNSAGRVLVAEQDGEVVGFVSGGPIREPLGGYDAELYAIYLLLHAQNKGIGTALLNELAKRLDDDGLQSMAVWVLEANAACRFYEGSGAVRVTSKKIEIGGALLSVTAYGWPSLRSIIVSKRAHLDA